jgi:hypothetical protein
MFLLSNSPCFFSSFVSTKVAKTTKQNKTNFLTNTKKQKGNNNEEKNRSIKGKKIKREPKLPLCQNLAMVATCTQEQQKKKKKKRELKPRLC